MTWLSSARWLNCRVSCLSSKLFTFFFFSLPSQNLQSAHKLNRNNKQALSEINDVSEGVASETLISFLELNLPKPGKKNKIVLGLSDKALAGSVKSAFPFVE